MRLQFYLLVFLLSLGEISAQVSFKAAVSRKEVTLGQRFQVEFSVNQEGQDFRPPSFQGFRVLGGPNTSVSTFMDNSGTRYNISYGYVLQANKVGEYTIDPAFINVDGKTYRTEAISIRVSEAKKSSQDGEPDLAFVKPIVTKSEVFLGEPIFAAYRLYYRKDMPIGAQNISAEPDFEGFYQQQVERDRIKEDLEYVNDIAYNAGNLREMVLIPQRIGSFEPGQLSVQMPVGIKTGRRDIWGYPITTTKNLNMSRSFPKITVKPLPEKGRPQNFSGAVGKFKLDASISASEINTDGSLRLQIRIEGTGNIKLVELPQVEFPSAFEVFDPEIKERSSVGSYGMQGYKQIEYLLVPRYKGTYKIGPVVFSYFDPKTEKYLRLESEVFEITVSGDALAPSANSQGLSGTSVDGENVDFINKDILFIKTEAKKWKGLNQQFLGSKAFYTWISLILLSALALIIWWWRKRSEFENRDALRVQRAGKMARKKLQKAQKALQGGSADSFYAELETAILGFFSDKLQVGVSVLNKEYLREKLQAAQCAPSDIDSILSLLSKSEMARFTGIKMEAASQDYEETRRVLTEIEKQL